MYILCNVIIMFMLKLFIYFFSLLIRPRQKKVVLVLNMICQKKLKFCKFQKFIKTVQYHLFLSINSDWYKFNHVYSFKIQQDVELILLNVQYLQLIYNCYVSENNPKILFTGTQTILQAIQLRIGSEQVTFFYKLKKK